MLQKQAGIRGTLDRGSPCRLSILGNANIAYLCCLFMPMLHVKFNKNLRKVLLHSIGPMLHVIFKKEMCHPVDFRVKGHTFACF